MNIFSPVIRRCPLSFAATLPQVLVIDFYGRGKRKDKPQPGGFQSRANFFSSKFDSRLFSS
jgi:hypothetical protein